MTIASRTWHHPEVRAGEVFVSATCARGFEQLDFASKRPGEVAYDGDGNRLSFDDWFPVFITTKELEVRGLDLASVRRMLWERGVPGCTCTAHAPRQERT